MAKRRFLPKYVTSFLDRHGREHLRFRRKGFVAGYFKAALGTEEFRIEYRGFMSGGIDPVAAAIDRAEPGSINDLVTRYFATPTRLGPTATTQAKVRRIIGGFRDEYGALPVARVTFEHIDKIIEQKLARRMAKTTRGMRPVGGPEAARKLRKELVRVFDFAVKLRLIAANPVIQADRVKVEAGRRSKGAHTWTEAEIAQYRAHHALGTNARLAMELMLWTGQRRIDAIRMGRQHIVDGSIRFTQSKTGTDLSIPLAPQLLEAIVAMPIAHRGHLCFLVTTQGRAFTNPGFGNWFRMQCDAAGLPQCSAHGLRKATMRRLAELHMGNQSLKSVSGHVNDEEVALYTRGADQQRMADHAIKLLAAWEKSNLNERLDTKGKENG